MWTNLKKAYKFPVLFCVANGQNPEINIFQLLKFLDSFSVLPVEKHLILKFQVQTSICQINIEIKDQLDCHGENYNGIEIKIFQMSSILVLSSRQISEQTVLLFKSSSLGVISDAELQDVDRRDKCVDCSPPVPRLAMRDQSEIFFTPRSAPAVRRIEVREGGEAGFETLKCQISQVLVVVA